MKAIIGIPAFNEEKNIGKLLDFLVKDVPEEIDSIYVVSSGSTDRTDAIVISRREKNPTINLVSEPVRGGKASALNTILRKGENHDAIICIDADHLPLGSSIKIIIESLKNDRLGVISGRLIPVDDAHSLQGFCVHLTYNLHHLISLVTPKISGEFMAFRTKVVTELHPTIVNDDVYIQMIFKNKGYEVGYCPEAKVRLKGPSTVADFFQQRRRIFVGHHQIRRLFGRVAPTMKWPGWKAIFRACPINGPRAKFYLFVFIALQGFALLFSMLDFLMGRVPYRWTIIESTKSIRS